MPLSSIYLLNPFAILSSVGCSVGSIENFLVILSVYGALSHHIILAACALSGAIYIGFHPILFTVRSRARMRNGFHSVCMDFIQLPIMLMVIQKSKKQRHDSIAFLAWLCCSLMGLSILSHTYLKQFPDHLADEWIPSITGVTRTTTSYGEDHL